MYRPMISYKGYNSLPRALTGTRMGGNVPTSLRDLPKPSRTFGKCKKKLSCWARNFTEKFWKKSLYFLFTPFLWGPPRGDGPDGPPSAPHARTLPLQFSRWMDHLRDRWAWIVQSSLWISQSMCTLLGPSPRGGPPRGFCPEFVPDVFSKKSSSKT